jgi:hypothetical protein
VHLGGHWHDFIGMGRHNERTPVAGTAGRKGKVGCTRMSHGTLETNDAGLAVVDSIQHGASKLVLASLAHSLGAHTPHGGSRFHFNPSIGKPRATSI